MKKVMRNKDVFTESDTGPAEFDKFMEMQRVYEKFTSRRVGIALTDSVKVHDCYLVTVLLDQ